MVRVGVYLFSEEEIKVKIGCEFINSRFYVGAEGFVPFVCFLKRYALFSLEPMPNISCSVSN
jgi:hypothetical protein